MTIEKIREVLALQDKFNSIVNPNWDKAGYPFYRAVWIEAGELMDHLNFKWWKDLSKTGDREQSVMEVVDMFHFVLSDAILHNRSAEHISGAYNKAFNRRNKNPSSWKEQVFDEIEAFIEIMLTDVRNGNGVPLVNFFDVVVAMDIPLDELLSKYIGKNVLNKFRQDNGYKAGTYQKEWFGEEDNVWLVRFRDELGSSLTFENLYNKLEEKYLETKVK